MTNPENKMKTRLIFILLLLLFAAGAGHAQNIRQSESVLITSQATNLLLTTPDTFEMVSRFEIDRESTITWNQKNGQMVDTYIITSMEGQWSNVAANGSIIYHVTGYEIAGKITLTRNGGGVRMIVDFTQNDPKALKHEFVISSFTTEN